MQRMKLGRNDSCHCGAGKKYKNCHYAIDAAERSRAPQQAEILESKDAASKLEVIIENA